MYHMLGAVNVDGVARHVRSAGSTSATTTAEVGHSVTNIGEQVPEERKNMVR
jgi:hypothetical protein